MKGNCVLNWDDMATGEKKMDILDPDIFSVTSCWCQSTFTVLGCMLFPLLIMYQYLVELIHFLLAH